MQQKAFSDSLSIDSTAVVPTDSVKVISAAVLAPAVDSTATK